MTTVCKSALVPYTPAQMFDLVDDIDRYPEFLPWCRSTEIISRTGDEVSARLELVRAGLHKTFTTNNRNQKNKMIEIRLVEGPFKRLQGFWRFDALGDDGCKISLDMEFEFSNRILTMTIGPVFNQITNTLIDAFTKRAEVLYGG